VGKEIEEPIKRKTRGLKINFQDAFESDESASSRGGNYPHSSSDDYRPDVGPQDDDDDHDSFKMAAEPSPRRGHSKQSAHAKGQNSVIITARPAKLTKKPDSATPLRRNSTLSQGRLVIGERHLSIPEPKVGKGLSGPLVETLPTTPQSMSMGAPKNGRDRSFPLDGAAPEVYKSANSSPSLPTTIGIKETSREFPEMSQRTRPMNSNSFVVQSVEQEDEFDVFWSAASSQSSM